MKFLGILEESFSGQKFWSCSNQTCSFQQSKNNWKPIPGLKLKTQVNEGEDQSKWCTVIADFIIITTKTMKTEKAKRLHWLFHKQN